MKLSASLWRILQFMAQHGPTVTLSSDSMQSPGGQQLGGVTAARVARLLYYGLVSQTEAVLALTESGERHVVMRGRAPASLDESSAYGHRQDDFGSGGSE